MKLSELKGALNELAVQKRLRVVDDSLIRSQMEEEFGEDFVDAASNDYLGLGARRHTDPFDLESFAIPRSAGAQAAESAGAELGQIQAPLVVQGGAHTPRGGQKDLDLSEDVSRETRTRFSNNERGDVSRETRNQLSNQAAQDVSRETQEAGVRVGASASRLIYGTAQEHLKVERFVADWVGQPEALLFSSGYAANIGALGALLSPGDAVFSDALNHASLIDGIRLSRAKPVVFRHLDCGDLEEKLSKAQAAPARWVIVESYYSMDGDSPDLVRLRELCDQYGADLYVDEAHSIGTFGPQGAGLCAEAGILPDVLMLAFGKAVGSHGACVAGSQDLRGWLWNRARSFVYSTAPSPLAMSFLLGQLKRARGADEQRQRLAECALGLRSELQEAGVPLVVGSFGPVLSVVVGGEAAALSLAELLRRRGVLAQAIRPPTVAVGQSRVRFVLRADLTLKQRKQFIQSVARETSRGGLNV